MNAKRWAIVVWLIVSMVMMVSTNETVSLIGVASCAICVFIGSQLAENGKL